MTPRALDHWQTAAWPFLRARLRSPLFPGEALRIERVIAITRVVLTAIAFAQVDRQALYASPSPTIAEVLLIFFAAHGLSALFLLHLRQRTTPSFALVTHGIDILAASLSLPSAAPPSPAFVFFLFVLASSAFRWGLREAVATNVVAFTLVVVYTELTIPFPALAFGAPYDFERVILRAGYLSVIGLFLGYLAEEGRLLRAEAAAVAGMLGRLRADAGVMRVLTSVASEVESLFRASRLLLAIENQSSHRAFRWDSATGWSMGPSVMPADSRGADDHRFVFGLSRETLAISRRWWRRPGPSGYRIAALDAAGRRIDSAHLRVPDSFAASYPAWRIVSAPVTFGDEWSGRIFVFNPGLNVRLTALAVFLRTLIRQVGPAIFSVYLQGELRSRAGAIERARVARELHDGVIQSLVGIEMQMEALRHQAYLDETAAGAEMQRLQGLLRQEVLNLRDLMTHMRSPDVDPKELLDYLAQLVDRFGRDSGITARFMTDLREVSLSRHVCFELVRIVQEGLVNIRKHSGATSVIVRFARTESQWLLEIDDNGRGFPFEGTLSLSELDTGRRGPIVIKDRVRAIGAELVIESMPHRGTRLRVLVPQEAYV